MRKPQSPRPYEELLAGLPNPGRMLAIMEAVASPTSRGRYFHWDELRFRKPPKGLSVPKKMLTDRLKPRDPDEQMIVNNYVTMQRILEWKGEPLAPEMVFTIHRQISENTLDVADGAGRFRWPDEPRVVSDFEGTVFHKPPPSEELASRMEAMCDFANGRTPDYFIHPVIRGIALHFWLAYDHPFVDRNGRTARALFYWAMLRAGYWLFQFISISQFLRNAPAKYGKAFLHTESDGNDLTYFILHQAEIIKRALKELHAHVARKSIETRSCLDALRSLPGLNHRQQAIIGHALRHPGHFYDIAGHRSRHAVSYATARADLLGLSEFGFLEQSRAGRAFIFVAPADLEARLKR